MSRAHSSPPAKSNALRMPVPVITHTDLPSVTGDGDDMFCFRSLWLPPPRGRCHTIAPVLRLTDHRCSVTASFTCSSSATLRKMRSPQMTGVEPENDGIASFHATFSVGDHFTGRFLSSLTPLRVGPRQFGQSGAPRVRINIVIAARMIIVPRRCSYYRLSLQAVSVIPSFRSE